MQKHNTRLPSLVLSTTVALIGAIVVVSIAFADESQSKSKLQSKSHHLNTLETVKQPTPPVIFPTSQQITPAVADGVDTAANRYETRHPSPPPENSGWWFNFFLVIFTGGLVAVGIGQCFLIFRTLKATEIAAAAAKKSADAIPALERPWIFVEKAHLKRREDAGSPIIPNYFWISFVCRNVGRTPAIIEEFFVKIHDKRTIPDIPDYSEPHIRLRCPATVATNVEFESSSFGPPSQPGATSDEVIFYVIYGKITYKELNGTTHHTGFSVEVSPHMAASTSHPNPAYDYYD